MFTGVNRGDARERVKSAAAVIVLHVAMAYAFITGLGVEILRESDEQLKLVEIIEAPPPPEIEKVLPQQARSQAEEGRASPENLRARPTQIVAPKPEIPLPITPPIVTAPVAGPGAESDAGASDRRGPGTGAGGIGNGLGSGGSGSGSGAGIGSEARLIRGRIVHRDYPEAAARDGVSGNVITRLSVGADGRVSRCIVTRSSGHVALDSTTCRLIEQRFRFEPARDLNGRPIASTFGWQQRWWLERD